MRASRWWRCAAKASSAATTATRAAVSCAPLHISSSSSPSSQSPSHLSSPPRSPSLLLRHLNCSLAVLRELYAAQGRNVRHAHTQSTQHNNGNDEGDNDEGDNSSSSSDDGGLPAEPADEAEGERIVSFVARELDMDGDAVRHWRAQLHRLRDPTSNLWGVAPLRTTANTHDNNNNNSSSSDATRWCRPRLQDVQFVRSAYADLYAILSPFVSLCPAPVTLPAREHAALQQQYDMHERQQQQQQHKESTHAATYTPPATRPRTHAETSTLYATRALPAGMFVLSLPTEAVLFAQPPSAAAVAAATTTAATATATAATSADTTAATAAMPSLHDSRQALLTYFLYIDDLVAQLVAAGEDARASHHRYAHYLMHSIVPCRNLPFLTRRDMQRLMQSPSSSSSSHGQEQQQEQQTQGRSNSDSNSDGEGEEESVAWQLWRFFHEEMAAQPLSPYLRTRLSRAEYVWWVSVVLSRREGAATLVPLLDKLNHDAAPNCHYTMSTQASFCGVDLFDNVVAGVSSALLYEPHVHVFTLRDVRAGEPLTVCYASASGNAYCRASHTMPDKPASLLSSSSPASSSHVAAAAADDAHVRKHVAQAQAAVREVLHSCSSSSNNKSSPRGQAGGSRLGRVREVDTCEGRAVWQLQWGFVPPRDAVYAASDLREVAALVAERRVNTRRLLFRRAASSSLLL